MLALFFIMMAALEWWRFYTNTKLNPVLFTWAAVLTAAYAGFRVWRALPKLRSLRQAVHGERAVGQFLERLREQGFNVFHDVVGKGFNVDHVLIGPPGVFTIETKTWSKPTNTRAEVSFDGDKLKIGSLNPERDPIIQAKAQAGWLRSLLSESTGRPFDVRPAIVFPGWFISNSAGSFKEVWVLEPKALVTVVATEWIEQQPVDVSTQVKKVIDAKADLIIGASNTTMATAILRAEQLHGVNIPTLAAPWHTIWPIAQAMKSYAPWEGHMVVTGVTSTAERDPRAWAFYQTLSKNYGLPAEWNPLNMLGISQALLTVRAVEHAARKVGGDKLTGQAVYDALVNTSFTEEELMGVLPAIKYSREAPFPLVGGKVKIETVKGGKYVTATPWQPIPSDVPKW